MNRAIAALLAYLILVFAGGAMLGTVLYKLVQSLAVDFQLFAGMAKMPFHRYVNRCLMILALVGLIPLSRRLGFRGFKDLGWTAGGQWASQLAKGFVLGFFSLGVLLAMALVFGGRTFSGNVTASLLISSLIKAALASILVAAAEETLFRGFLQRSLATTLGGWKAIIVSSLVYALVHFFKRVENPEVITWGTGFVVLGGMLSGFADLQSLFPALVNLTLAGIILGYCFSISGSLYLPAGLHAGWVFWIKVFGLWTASGPSSNPRFWGAERLVDGWAAGLVLAFLLLLIKSKWQGDAARPVSTT